MGTTFLKSLSDFPLKTRAGDFAWILMLRKKMTQIDNWNFFCQIDVEISKATLNCFTKQCDGLGRNRSGITLHVGLLKQPINEFKPVKCTEVRSAPLIHFKRLVLYVLKLVRKFKFYIEMTISGSKRVKVR